MIGRAAVSLVAGLSLLLSACGGGGGAGSSNASVGGAGGAATLAAPAAEALTTGDVQQILAQAITQAQADGQPAVISVVDRVGNVLALFRMTGAPATAHIADAPNGSDIQLQGLNVPAEASAIAKAITGAYLSSGGNAFSTRTASEIVQPQFPPEPGTVGLGSGPLFGVQFSQLPCSDLSQRFGAAGAAALIGPKRSPLGLSADPGGFPLYKNGVVVGGIGVEADGQYSYDSNVQATNLVTDERIALAGTVGYDAPAAILASTIYAAGVQLIYSDVATNQLTALGGANYATAAAQGTLEALTGYTAGAIIAGSTYGSEASGIRPATGGEFATAGAFVLSDGAGNNRYPARAGTDGADVASPLTASEVQTILTQAYAVMSEARAAIRNPISSPAQVSISVVDTHGVPLGLVRGPDAPIFGIDVSLQKARTAAFNSNASAAADLLANPGPTAALPGPKVASFVAAVRAFLKDPAALTGRYAFTDRAGGDLSRPTFPDGTVGSPNGPFSVPAAQFNPFATGLQAALILDNLAAHLAYVTGAAATDTPQRCTTSPDVVPGQNRVQNGIQIFPGSVPIYRGGTLVGGLGVSGDGVGQDDMISFLGLNNAGQQTGTIGNAPVGIRADQIVVPLSNGNSAHLDYVLCPQSPFINSNAQNVCQGL
ncbi:MAG: heme-binding protein [Sphingomonadales bacterium]|nr:heme-binding protein [Sphingomonadales bacterium]